MSPKLTAADARKRVKELEDEVATLGRAIEQTVHAIDHDEPVPIHALREALTGRWYNRWTRDDLIVAGRAWAEQYGAPPKAVEWNPANSQAKAEDRERFYSGDWPTLRMVTRKFPRWNDYMEACGFVPRTGPDRSPGGSGAADERWPTWEGWRILPHLRNRVGMTQGQLAKAANCSPGSIAQFETARANGSANLPNPSIRLLLSLAKALGLSARVFIDDDENQDISA